MAYEGSTGKVICRYCRTVVGKRSPNGLYHMYHLRVVEMKPMFMSYGARTTILIEARVVNNTMSALPPSSYYLKPLLENATASASLMLPMADPSSFVSGSVPPSAYSGPSTSSMTMSGAGASLAASFSGSSSLLQPVPCSAPEVRRKRVKSTATEKNSSVSGSDHLRSLLNVTIPRLEQFRSSSSGAVDLTGDAALQQTTGEVVLENSKCFSFSFSLFFPN